MAKWIKPDKVLGRVAERAKAAGRSTGDYVKERAFDPKEGRAASVVMMSIGGDTPDRPMPKSREEKRYGKEKVDG